MRFEIISLCRGRVNELSEELRADELSLDGDKLNELQLGTR
jgi:hypothetical protein